MRTILVVLKEPPVHIRLTGRGAAEVLAVLQAGYPERLEILEDDDSEAWVDVTQTEWYRGRAAQMSAGRCLHIYRENAGMTLSRLAELSGFSKRVLTQIEHDQLTMQPSDARILAKVLGCDHRRLLSR